ncbi:hypothetical protein B0H11DRAFT_1746190, partial [Mycena galericulata]
ISSSCETALTQVAENSDANACLSLSSLLTTFINSNASIIAPVDNMLKSLCAAAPCSNATLSAVYTNARSDSVTTGCSAELSLVDGSGSSVSNLTQWYSTARQIICLTEQVHTTGSGTNCITETLTNIQNILGTLSLNNIGNVAANAFTTSTIPSNVTCSNCIKEAYNVLESSFPATASTAASALQSECGSDFTNGSTPSNIIESASKSKTGSNSASAIATIMPRGALAGLSASVLVVGSTLWAVLA